MQSARNTACVISVLAGMVLAAPAGAADSEALPVKIKPDDARIRYIGRFDRSQANPRCAWPGSSIRVTFNGTAINALLTDTARADTNKDAGLNTDYLNAVIDDGAPRVFPLEKGRTVYRVGDALAPGNHTLLLFKRTESYVGIVEFHGLELPVNGHLVDTPAPARRIEFIGDSITCGYGNEAPDQTMHFNAATENNYLAYGALTARHFGADYQCLAWSGIGVWSSRGDTNNVMRTRYGTILPWAPHSTWDFAQWTPDVVVINLGTNDFAKQDPGENYIAAYAELLKRVRGNYPNAPIVCCLGPMMWGESLKKNRDDIRAAMERSGLDKLSFVDFGPQDAKANGLGGDWHPSLKTHAAMSKVLIDAVAGVTGWK